MSESIREDTFCEYRNLVMHKNKIHALFHTKTEHNSAAVALLGVDEIAEYLYIPVEDLWKRQLSQYDMNIDASQTYMAIMAYEAVLSLVSDGALSNNIDLLCMPESDDTPVTVKIPALGSKNTNCLEFD